MFLTARAVNNVQIVYVLFLALLKSRTLVHGESCFGDSINCVCSYEYLKIDLRERILSSSPKDLIGRLQSYQCQQFRLLPNVLTTGQQVNARSPHSSGEEFGPENYQGQGAHFGMHKPPMYYSPYNIPRRRRRQIADSVENQRNRLEKVVYQLPAEAVPHSYAFLGHRIQIPCNANTGPTYRGLSFNWLHSNGDPVYAPGVSLDEATGVLTIPAVQLVDIDTYQCEEVLPNGQNATTSHRLSVVTGSIHWLNVRSYYQSLGCYTEEMQEIQKSLKGWIANFICPICTVHDSAVTCEAGSAGSTQYVIQFALTAFNFENEIDSRIDLGLCPELCLQAIHLLLLNIVQDSVRKLFARPIQVSSGNSLYPSSGTVNVELMTGCLAGFEFQSKICFPCHPGHYSERGESDCVECSHGSYQSALASSRCIPCKEGEDTIDDGATSSSACLPLNLVKAYHSVDENRSSAAAAIVILVLLFLSVISCIVCCCCCPQTKGGRCLRNFCCFPCKFWPKSQAETNSTGVQAKLTIRKESRSKNEGSAEKIKEISQEEYRGSGTRTPKKSLKKIVRSKLPLVLEGSKKQFEYSHLADPSTSDESESEMSQSMDSSTTIRQQDPDPSSNNVLPQKNSSKRSENGRKSSLNYEMRPLSKHLAESMRNSSANYEIQNSRRNSIDSRKDPSNFEHEVQNSRRHSIESRKDPSNFEHDIQNSRRHSIESRKDPSLVSHEVQSTRRQSIESRKDPSNAVSEIPNSRRHSMESRGGDPSIVAYEVRNPLRQSVESQRDPSILDYSFQNTPKHSTECRREPRILDHDFQNTPKHSTESRREPNGVDQEFENTRRNSIEGRRDPRNLEIQNTRRHSVESRRVDPSVFNSEMQNPPGQSFDGRSRKWMDECRSRQRQLAESNRKSSVKDVQAELSKDRPRESVETSRNSFKRCTKSIVSAYRDRSVEKPSVPIFPTSTVGVQTQPGLAEVCMHLMSQTKSQRVQQRTDSCERYYDDYHEDFQSQPAQSITSPIKTCADDDDEAVSRVRVRETIQKINAASNLSEQRSTADVPPSRGQHRSLDCSKGGHDPSHSGDNWQPPLDSRWDHNCHRCIKPSLRQPRFLPPLPK